MENYVDIEVDWNPQKQQDVGSFRFDFVCSCIGLHNGQRSFHTRGCDSDNGMNPIFFFFLQNDEDYSIHFFYYLYRTAMIREKLNNDWYGRFTIKILRSSMVD